MNRLRNAVNRLRKWLRGGGSPAPLPVPRVEPAFPKPLKIAASEVALSRRKRLVGDANPWEVPEPPPGVLPKGGLKIAQDESISGVLSWAAEGAGFAGLPGLFGEGLSFQGYPWLAELAQRPEYRRGSEIIAKEMTREWLELTATGEGDKSEKLQLIDDEMKRLTVQDKFREAAEHDGFFGKGQIFLDFGNRDNDSELATQLIVDKRKIGASYKLQRLTTVEPIWTYPAKYNTTDPLAPDFYKPQAWYARGREVHASRWLTFIAREVPDMLKPSYMFGGLSLSQMGKPAVDNWLGTRKSVSDLICAFSQMILKTNMQATLSGEGGTGLADRIAVYNNYRDNSGVMAIDKETEDFANVAAPLGSLDKLQAQAQEHMPSIWGIPLVIYFGITPSGLNASTDGELAAWNTWVHSMQEALFNGPITKLIQIIQLCLFGEIDPTIGHKWIPLGKMSEMDKAIVRKTDAETGAILIGDNAIDPVEERRRVVEQEDSLYAGLNADDAPDLGNPDLDPADDLDPLADAA